MAISVASWAQTSSWYTTTTPKTIAVSWSTGDRIVVFGATENNGATLSTPTLTGFTFTLVCSQTSGAGNSEADCAIWTTGAAASASSGNISVARTGATLAFGACAWVITGSPSTTNGVNSGNDNVSESNVSLTVSAGSIVCYGLDDWNAANNNETPVTGSGTATERLDQGDLATHGQYVADWVGTSAGTFSFGPNTYTGIKASQVAVEIKAGAAAAASIVVPHRGGSYRNTLIRR